jgi:hypothetical protein
MGDTFTSCRTIALQSGRGSAAPDRSVYPVKAQNGCGAVLFSGLDICHVGTYATIPILLLSPTRLLWLDFNNVCTDVLI